MGSVVFVLALFSCFSITNRDNSHEIPIDQIWALEMPNTKDVKKLAPDDSAKIRRSLMRRAAARVAAGPCFLVVGEGKEALTNAAKVIVEGKSPLKTLPSDSKLSLVFYSFAAPGYVHLRSVTESNSKITALYEVVTHRTLEASVHFALIPLGKRSSGQLTVETKEVPPQKPYQHREKTDKAVCDSCSFNIQTERKQQ